MELKLCVHIPIEDLCHSWRTYFMMRSYSIAVLSQVLPCWDGKRISQVPALLPWHFLHINSGSTNQKIRDPSSGPQDYPFESLNKLWKSGQGRGEAFLYSTLKKVSFKESPWARYLILICSTQVRIVKVCSVCILNTLLYDWVEWVWVCSRAKFHTLCEKEGFSEFQLTDSEICLSRVLKCNPDLELLENLLINFYLRFPGAQLWLRIWF